MEINDYPSYIDENFRMNFVKNSKERVYWISPKFSKNEIDVVNEAKKKLHNNCVNSHEYSKSTLSDRGHSFYLEDEHICIDI